MCKSDQELDNMELHCDKLENTCLTRKVVKFSFLKTPEQANKTNLDHQPVLSEFNRIWDI